MPRPPVQHGCALCYYPRWQSANATGDWSNYKLFFPHDKLVRMLVNFDCVGCKILSNAWRLYVDKNPSHKSVLMELTRNDGIVIRLLEQSNSLVRSVIEVFTLPGSPRLENVRVARLVPESTKPEHSLPLIRQWLADCSSNHDACSRQSFYTPPRLLDVRGDGTTVRLVENAHTSDMNDQQAGVRYACLSHCWGSFRPKQMLTRSNIDTNKRSILTEELPATFQQAIGLCRELGLDYLWIDSLNVVQDSDEDWKYHVTEMRKIYQQAYVTLAAVASADDTGGLFRTNTTQHAARSKMRFANEGTSYEVHFRTRPDMADDSITRAPLLGRAWVLQERLLSRRFILFCREELIWECRQSVWCSCSIGPFVPSLSQSSIRFEDRLAHEDPKVIIAALSDLAPRSRYSQWHRLLELYSECRMTKPNDKLPAIAGLARLFKDELDDEYVAGMWKGNLHADIAWGVTVGKSSNTGMRLRKGPSWAWPSAGDGPISFRSMIETETYRLNDISIQRSGEDEFDYLDSGALTIHGILFPARVEAPCLRLIYDTVKRGALPYTCYVQDTRVQNGCALAERENSVLRNGHIWPDFMFWNEDEHDDSSRRTKDDSFQAYQDGLFVFTIFFLGIMTFQERWPNHGLIQHVNGLILREKKDTGGFSQDDESSITSDNPKESIKKFERIGRLHYHIQEEFSSWKASRAAKTTFQLV